MFSSVCDELGNQFESSILKNADPSNLGRFPLEGKKDHLLSQARSELMKQELHVESLKKCIVELQRQTEEQRLALQDAQYGFVETRQKQVRLQQELFVKEKVLRNTPIRNSRNGRNEETQEQRIGEVSVQKLRESYDTIQRLTAQIQRLQERVNCMNDSGKLRIEL